MKFYAHFERRVKRHTCCFCLPGVVSTQPEAAQRSSIVRLSLILMPLLLLVAILGGYVIAGRKRNGAGSFHGTGDCPCQCGSVCVDVTFIKGRLDMGDGLSMYDIEFYTADTEYDYEINAATGTVHSRSHESIPQISGTNATDSIGTYIGVDQAKESAAEHAGVPASEVPFTKAMTE
ncbi:PepSY domain-containing protein [Novisyntrophococcus fermenticellae]|uniref:PepSY domain-containing protein n=1 Tax=Novisyntrophococcus fermenticellae TaxID=2068655 RepID=UPI001E3289E5|nr:hypothetical protein [Novisyntrophococcus fermenticellae]